jgi:hypothetical protein
VIFKAQQLYLIYAHSRMFYHILLDAPRSTYDPRKNFRPHFDGIVGSANVKLKDSVTRHFKELSVNQSAGGPYSFVSSNLTHSVDVHSMQSLTSPNGNQKLGRIRRKDVIIIIRVGKIIINPRTMVIMRRRIIMLERERKKDVS